MPMVFTPPTRPKKVGRNGSLTGPPTRRGRRVLSTMKSSTLPQTISAIPATRCPEPTRYSDTKVNDSGAPPGISAMKPVPTPSSTGDGTPATQ
ncbi:hypothetical protein G6F32_016456 [Rhizopus arrhizus]|nr:hypothetical protein G6F32_016456 [Rhizopus arrhizus]